MRHIAALLITVAVLSFSLNFIGSSLELGCSKSLDVSIVSFSMIYQGSWDFPFRIRGGIEYSLTGSGFFLKIGFELPIVEILNMYKGRFLGLYAFLDTIFPIMSFRLTVGALVIPLTPIGGIFLGLSYDDAPHVVVSYLTGVVPINPREEE